MMNRREAVIWLMDNPTGKLRLMKDVEGHEITQEYMYEIDKYGYFVHNGAAKQIYIKNDKSEFEIVRELKQMSFVNAVKLIINTSLYMSSVDGKHSYYNSHEIVDLDIDTIDGQWTVEGVYE